MHDPNLNEAPFNPIPPAVLLLVAAVVIPELVFQAAERGMVGGARGIGWRNEMGVAFGFSDRLFNWMLETRSMAPEHWVRFLTYSFVHLSFVHTMFVTVFTLALGKFVAESLRGWVVVILFFASAVIGALGYGLILDEPSLLLGGYPAVYGLIGGFTWVMYVGLTHSGESGARAFGLIGFFMAIQLIWKLLFGGTNEWLAELIGFIVGFGLAIALSPGRAQRFQNALARIRRR